MKAIENYIYNEKDEFEKIKLDFSYKTIKRIDNLIKYHNSIETSNNSEILINIFGLLQSLFVSIDALYTLTLTITNSKNYININKNENLNKLKFIRNDVVGHPINRKYKNNSIGYGLINFNNIKVDEFKFDIYVNNNSNIVKREEIISLTELKESYITEKNKVLKKLEKFINKEIYPTNLDILITNLYTNLTTENLRQIKKIYKNSYNDEGDRFLWRLSLLEILINYTTTNERFNEIINYSKNYQINKLVYILNEIENKNVKVNKIKVPKMLDEIYNYFNTNREYLKYLDNISDTNNPQRLNNIDYLLNRVTNEDVKYILTILKNEKSRSKIYLIGSILNNYYKSML